ncbi:MAG: TonB-dependent receptor [Alphaproteobacteria bacterium]|nr:TonB-dependent receptor [Alphaproteobacteria bacterium]
MRSFEHGGLASAGRHPYAETSPARARRPGRRFATIGHTSLWGLILAALPFDEPKAQDSVSYELPAVEVVVTPPPPTKYPATTVARKRPVGAPTTAASGAATTSGTTTASGTQFEGQGGEFPSATAIPGIAVVGDIIPPGPRGTWELDGSGQVVTPEELYTSHVLNTNEALRKVTGVNVRDEEGFGLRPNIGIRGLNPTRSTKVLLLEDGLFLTYAPYGANESYFHPLMDRYNRVEVIKGADMLLYGPQTISGTINYVTPNPPAKPSGFVAATGGNRDYFNGQAFYGGWYNNLGGLVDYVHKEGKGARNNTFHKVDDVGVKAIALANPDSAFIAKFSYFTEDSEVTYSGITDAERRNFGIRYNPFDNDTFNTDRYGASLVNAYDFNQNINFRSSLYYNSFSRDWWRQSSRTTDTQCDPSYPGFRNDRLHGILVDPDRCNSIQGRLRDYYLIGFEERITAEYALTENVGNQLKTGFRFHQEGQERRQENELFVTGGTTLVELNERDAFAASFFVQDRVQFNKFSITPAFRYEDIEYERTNKLPVGGCARPPCVGRENVHAFIPGISLGYDPANWISLFAGVHEGFAPPRVEDSIANDGGSIDINPEESVNLEVGFRSEPRRGLYLDSTYFRNDFSNLIAVGSVAGGDNPLAEGEALFEGLEVLTRFDSGRMYNKPWSIYGQVAFTWLPVAEQLTPFISVTTGLPLQGDTAGNRQPYAPEYLVTPRIGYATSNWDINIEMVYVSSQFGDFLNLRNGAQHPNGPNSVEALSGMFGEIPSYAIFNFATTYTIEKTNTDIYFTIKNLFDDEFIVDRTRGILPGAPRLVQLGLKQNF